MGVAFSFGVSLVATVASLASFQIGYLWSFEELTAEADLVVIAERVGTDDTGRRTEHPDLKPGLPVVELATVFKVLAVLKVDTRATSSDTSRVQLKHIGSIGTSGDAGTRRSQASLHPALSTPGRFSISGMM